MKRKMNTLVLIGRRWFNRGPGNTYHSCDIIVDGKQVYSVDYAYGSDQMYEDSAKKWLDANGYLPGIEKKEGTPGESLWRYCDRLGIEYTRTATDVKRKKDL